ncbi:MAG: type II secretion system GspH family protein [Planctomycetes bacterium]|nr:type II secretion system GspH family protein [Planctomycetota bacterium]
MSRRRGFTLIELLITVTIIGMLASMLLFGLMKVQSQTQGAKTKTTITKLDALFRPRWDAFGTRRMPVSSIGVSPKDAAELRLIALRQIQRMEMPDHWAEVTTAPTELKKINGSNSGVTLTRTALAEAYLRYYNTVGVNKPGAVPPNDANGKPSKQYQAAECLYMILTIGAMDDRNGRELFLDSEIADTDGDGAFEFVDAWGMPIRMIRWPVGFIDDPRQDSSAQTRFGHLSDIMPPKSASGAAAPLVACKPDAINYHDAFDPRRVDTEAFLVYPLIFSNGPDRIEDIYTGVDDQVCDDPYTDLRADSTPCGAYDPLAAFTAGSPSVGLPKLLGIPHDLKAYRNQTELNTNGKLNHYDNVHNHAMDASFR